MEEKLEWVSFSIIKNALKKQLQAFKVYDLDDNGNIARDEMVQIVKAMISMAGDENAQQSAEERVAKIFDVMDTVRNRLKFYYQAPKS